ncbi:FliC/FljB family flagellin [Polaromonas sp. CG_9.11]|uniref:FliC/FljB family flagellin n=1 Tax=Polaromonas sp. CG_9.11 TaxID=2787730 RepID=UPI0018C986C9|nr:FliC/FljB family flagellin [Polaromonas sp. CG_9.11]MBG6077614.1 flagellin [Polaromonas sp. CG_9.11]
MGQVINTNSLSLLTQNNLNKSQASLNTSIQRLSSGMRINSAKDDAAGQAIANRFTANIKGLTQAQRNANDGISLAQTTEGALNEINTNLQRVRELTVQATNGSNSNADKASIQAEITQRMAEVDRTSTQTDFNGVKVLSASAKPLNVQVGANDGETIAINLTEISSKTLGMQNFSVSGPTATNLTTGSFDGVQATAAGQAPTAAQLQSFYGATTAVTTTVVAEKSTDTLSTALGMAAGGATLTGNAVTDKNGSLYAEVKITPASAGEASSLVNQGFTGATSGTAMYRYVALDPQSAVTATTTATFTIDTSKITAASMSIGGTAKPLAAIDAALKKVDDLRGSLGAVQNRFDSIISNLGTTVTNLSSSRSRIEDADYATEVSNMTRAQILQQAGTSVLAKANQSTQGVMSLLQ